MADPKDTTQDIQAQVLDGIRKGQEAVIDGMRGRGLIGDDGWLSEQGRAVKQRVESLTDDLAAKPYECLEPGELDELMADLEPLATLLLAAQDWG